MMPKTDRKGHTNLSPSEALGVCWRSWAVLLLICLGGLLAVFLTQPASLAQEGRGLAGVLVLVVALVWLVLLGVVVLVLRSYCFRALWDERPVEPGSYVKGMYQVWGVLTIGSLLAVLGTVLSGAFLPGGLVVLVVLVLLVFSRPSGRALGV